MTSTDWVEVEEPTVREFLIKIRMPPDDAPGYVTFNDVGEMVEHPADLDIEWHWGHAVAPYYIYDDLGQLWYSEGGFVYEEAGDE